MLLGVRLTNLKDLIIIIFKVYEKKQTNFAI